MFDILPFWYKQLSALNWNYYQLAVLERIVIRILMKDNLNKLYPFGFFTKALLHSRLYFCNEILTWMNMISAGLMFW